MNSNYLKNKSKIQKIIQKFLKKELRILKIKSEINKMSRECKTKRETGQNSKWGAR